MPVADLPLQDPNTPWPSLHQLLEHTHIVSIPLNTKFRGVQQREVAIFTGGYRTAEFSPFLEYVPQEAATWLAAALNFGYSPALPSPQRAAVPVNATVPAVTAEHVPALLARYGDGQKIHTVKIKVAEAGENLDDDITRVLAVHQHLPHAALRIDANGGYTHQMALDVLTELQHRGIELQYAEQPVAGIEPLARLRDDLRGRGIDTKIAADEAVRKEEDPLRVATLKAADVIVVKAQPLGGVYRATQIIERAGLPAVISSALDTGIGINMGATLAAALPELPFACGLATGALFTDDVLTEADHRSLYREVGYLHPTQAHADEAKLVQYRAAPERVDWWQRRIAECYEVLNRRNKLVMI